MRGAFLSSLFPAVPATLVWTLSWVVTACVAVVRVAASPDGQAFLALGVTVFMTACGCWLMARAFRAGSSSLARGGGSSLAECRAPREPWSRRISGWLAGLVWSAFAVVWNIGIIVWLVRAADEGLGWLLLVSIPWSLAAWFLLMVLFTGVGVMIDSLLKALRQPRL